MDFSFSLSKAYIYIDILYAGQYSTYDNVKLRNGIMKYFSLTSLHYIDNLVYAVQYVQHR